MKLMHKQIILVFIFFLQACASYNNKPVISVYNNSELNYVLVVPIESLNIESNDQLFQFCRMNYRGWIDCISKFYDKEKLVPEEFSADAISYVAYNQGFKKAISQLINLRKKYTEDEIRKFCYKKLKNKVRCLE